MSEPESDEQEFSQPESEQKVQIEVKNSEETEKLKQKQKELEEKLEKAESQNLDVIEGLEKIAEKEFSREKAKVAQALKIDPSLIEDPSDLKAYEKLLKRKEAEQEHADKNKAPNHGTPLSGAQTGDDYSSDWGEMPLEFRNYQSEAEMILDLENERKKGNKEAERYLSKLTKKALKKEFDAEFVGDLPKSAGKGEESKKERKKWREVK